MRAAAGALLLALAGCSNGTDPQRAALAAAPLATRLAHADASRGAQVFARCAACHTIRAGTGDRDGPNLHDVIGAAVGHVSPTFGYTAALQTVGGRWTAERLDAWLKDPRAFAPGTAMMFPGLSDGMDRADVIAFLAEQR